MELANTQLNMWPLEKHKFTGIMTKSCVKFPSHGFTIYIFSSLHVSQIFTYMLSCKQAFSPAYIVNASLETIFIEQLPTGSYHGCLK